MKISNELKALFVILSTVFGLGIFVLPYTFAQSGYYFFLWLIFWFLSFLIFHLIWSEVIFQTQGKHNLPGLAGIYLNSFWKHLVWFFDYFGMLGVFLVYFLALAKFWSLITDLNPLIIKLIFAIFNLYFIFKDLRILAHFETILSLGIIFTFLIISAILLPYFNLKNIETVFFNPKDPFLPYGVLLFAFTGTSAIPLVYDLIGKNKKSFFKVNLLSLLIIALVYLLYALLVTGVLADKVSEESLGSLSYYLPKFFLIFAIILVTLNITFVDMAFYLKRGLIYDYNLSPKLSNLILAISVIPLIFFEPSTLIKTISLVSEIFIGFNFLVINLIYLKLKKREYFKIPSFLIIIISIVLIFSLIYGLLPK